MLLKQKGKNCTKKTQPQTRLDEGITGVLYTYVLLISLVFYNYRGTLIGLLTQTAFLEKHTVTAGRSVTGLK